MESRIRMQGDVMVIHLSDEQAAKVQAFLKEKNAKPVGTPVVVAYGEASGHQHQIETGVDAAWEVEVSQKELTDLTGLEFLVDEARRAANRTVHVIQTPGTEIMHKNVHTGQATVEHGTLPIESGMNIVIRQEEFGFDEYRRVID